MMPERSRSVREHALLCIAVLATRAALHGAGLEFAFSLDWMWLADPADLRERLLETLYYFHAFPPGMNLLTGVLLKAGGPDAAALALAAFMAIGLALVNALYYLCRAAGLSRAAAGGLALGFALLPQSIYFEHLYIYEYPVAALLLLAAAWLHAGVRRAAPGAPVRHTEAFAIWSAFFLACAAIGLTRSTFHLIWFAGVAGLAMRAAGPAARGLVLRAAAAPALLLLALYVKNFALFGTFDAFTFGPVSQNLVTVWHLPPEVRDSWIEDGRLSPFAAISVYAGPREYLPFIRRNQQAEWPPQLTRLDRPSLGAPNYNHWLFLEVNRARRADALRYVVARPLAYLATAARGLRDLFTPSTQWHPLDASGGSPHERHRQVLGAYEAAVNRLLHGFPVPPVGMYACLPLVLAWAGWRARSLARAGDPASRARAAVMAFCLFQVVYVVAASSLFTYRESSRYRFQIEAMMWWMTALCVTDLWARWRARREDHAPRRHGDTEISTSRQ